MIRTLNQNELIKKNHSASKQYVNALTENDINDLINYYLESDEIIKKNTGPKVLFLKPDYPIFQKVKNFVENNLDNYKIRSIHFFDTQYPHMIHNDDDYNHPMAYKAFVFPLKIIGQGSDAKFVTFDQYYYNGPAKFLNREHMNKKVFYNMPVTCYTNVAYKSNKLIEENFKKEYLSHLKDEWLEGLSIEQVFDWKVGSAICFDSLRLHCASNFKSKNINSKIGLSVFTVLS